MISWPLLLAISPTSGYVLQCIYPYCPCFLIDSLTSEWDLPVANGTKRGVITISVQLISLPGWAFNFLLTTGIEPKTHSVKWDRLNHRGHSQRYVLQNTRTQVHLSCLVLRLFLSGSCSKLSLRTKLTNYFSSPVNSLCLYQLVTFDSQRGFLVATTSRAIVGFYSRQTSPYVLSVHI